MHMSDLQELSLSYHCPKTFEELSGCGATRHCSQCQKQVTDLSSLTQEQALRFLAAAPSKTCVHYKASANGKVLFKKVPATHWFLRFRGLVASLLAILLPGSFSFASDGNSEQTKPPTDNTYREADECDFNGELSPFTVEFPPRKKRSLSFHTRKNYQNNLPSLNDS